MSKTVTLVFEFEDDEFSEFMDREDVQHDLHNWIFAELCQNNSFGFLTRIAVQESDEE